MSAAFVLYWGKKHAGGVLLWHYFTTESMRTLGLRYLEAYKSLV